MNEHNTQDLISLTRRLEQLERSAKRIRTAVLAALASTAALLLFGTALSLPGPSPAPVPSPSGAGSRGSVSTPVTVPADDTVRTKRLVIVDGTGATRASLASLADGTCALKIYDRNRKLRVTLSVQADGKAELNLCDNSGTRRGAMSVAADGVPELRLNGADWTIAALYDPFTRRPVLGQPVGNCVIAGVNAQGIPHLTLNGKRGVGTAHMDVWTDGNPRLLLRDGEGHEKSVTP